MQNVRTEWIVLGIIAYLIPSFVASIRRHDYRISIYILNLFLGFTFVGWVVALVWASTDQSNSRHRRDITMAYNKAVQQINNLYEDGHITENVRASRILYAWTSYFGATAAGKIVVIVLSLIGLVILGRMIEVFNRHVVLK